MQISPIISFLFLAARPSPVCPNDIIIVSHGWGPDRSKYRKTLDQQRPTIKLTSQGSPHQSEVLTPHQTARSTQYSASQVSQVMNAGGTIGHFF